MNAPLVFTPGLLHAVAWYIIGTTIAVTAFHIGTFAMAAQRAALPRQTARGASLLVLGFLSAWAAWAITAVPSPLIVPEPAPSGGHAVILLSMVPMFVVAIAAIFGSQTMRTVNAATPPAWLIGIQVYRAAGILFLWPFLAASALPAGFALPAGIGDALTGLAAPFVALAVARDVRGARRWAVAWNCFGMLDLVVAPVAAVLAHSTNIARFPLVVVPLFLGPPLGILTHLRSLQNLATTERLRRDATVGSGHAAVAA